MKHCFAFLSSSFKSLSCYLLAFFAFLFSFFFCLFFVYLFIYYFFFFLLLIMLTLTIVTRRKMTLFRKFVFSLSFLFFFF